MSIVSFSTQDIKINFTFGLATNTNTLNLHAVSRRATFYKESAARRNNLCPCAGGEIKIIPAQAAHSDPKAVAESRDYIFTICIHEKNPRFGIDRAASQAAKQRS